MPFFTLKFQERTCYCSPNHLLLPPIKTANFEKRISDNITGKFKIKTQTVDSAKEVGGFTNWKIVKKQFNFGRLTG